MLFNLSFRKLHYGEKQIFSVLIRHFYLLIFLLLKSFTKKQSSPPVFALFCICLSQNPCRNKLLKIISLYMHILLYVHSYLYKRVHTFIQASQECCTKPCVQSQAPSLQERKSVFAFIIVNQLNMRDRTKFFLSSHLLVTFIY